MPTSVRCVDLALFKRQIFQTANDLLAEEEAVAEAVVYAGLGPEGVDGAIGVQVEVAVGDVAGSLVEIGELDPLAEGLVGDIGGMGVEQAAEDIVPLAAGDFALGVLGR